MSNWTSVFTSRYRDGATIITEHNGVDINLRIRREAGKDAIDFVITPEQALEIAYALLRAQQQLIYDREQL